MGMHEIYAEKPRRDVVEIKLQRSVDQRIIKNYLADESAVIKGNAEEVVFPRTETRTRFSETRMKRESV